MRWFVALLAVLWPALAPALESAPVVSSRVRATLHADLAAAAPGGTLRLALHQQLAPGWHVYWANPGDAGQPPELVVTAPTGVAAGALRFAAPARIPFGPLVNFGFEGEATFVLPLTLPATLPAGLRPGETLPLEVEATWLVCERVCIPESGRFRLDLPIAAVARADPAAADRFAAFEAAEPRPSPFAARVGFAGNAGALELSGPELGPGRVREAFFFPVLAGVLDHAAPQPLTLRDSALRLGLSRGTAALPPSIEGVVAITDAAGVRAAWSVTAVPGAVPASGTLPLGRALALAALGGLLLNLMPCVFPVLAMKAMALARLSGAARAAVRGQAASYTAGVLACFLALGGALVAARGAGLAAGWGFQLTSPVFVALLAWLMLAVGLNLSGVFALGGPVGAGGRWAARGGHPGAFATGVLAVLVATPCTAPFMAAAIGAALILPAPAAMAVFAALGAGMAAPTALLAAWPGLASRLPRPDRWMEWLRGALAFPMYAAAGWLVWVLAQQAGPDAVLAALAGGVLIGFVAWAAGVAQRAGRVGRRAAGGAAVLAAAAAVALLPGLAAPGAAAVAATTEGEAWSEARLAELRAAGRPVFVNLTAAWCLTCKVNERVALRTTAVRAAFADRDVTLLTGDWTRGDPAVGALLRAQGREGVPLYLYYAPGSAAPAVLPQLLTEGIVLRALVTATADARPR